MSRSGDLSLEERRWLRVLSTLNEAQARLYVADKAMDLGRGGISWLSELTGMSRTTITKAVGELVSEKELMAEQGRIRERGAGRRKVEEADRELVGELQRILEETTAGDPMSELRWTNKSAQAILHFAGSKLQTLARSTRRRAAAASVSWASVDSTSP